MSVVAHSTLTAEELLAMPDDGVTRELIRGELREYLMTRRSRRHSPVESRISQALCNWLDKQPSRCGLVASGDVGFRLSRDPDTCVGVDVAYVSQEVVDREPDSSFFEGAPVLAVEILSASDTHESVEEKVDTYLETGVALIWVVNPWRKTVSVYRRDADSILYNQSQEIDAEPHLPGFRCRVAAYF